MSRSPNRIVRGDNLAALRTVPTASVSLIYLDPPFNKGAGTGRRKHRQRSKSLGDYWFDDRFRRFVDFIEPRLREAYRVLAAHGSLFLHLNQREGHRCKLLLDGIFGRQSFINEIIWAYEQGRRPQDRWAAQHDSILWYAKDPRRYTFNLSEARRLLRHSSRRVERTPNTAPTDVWRLSALHPRSAERTGYPAQKPLALLDRIVRVHSIPGELVLDCFAGSGTTGEAAARSGRRYYLIDSNPQAVRIMARRLAFSQPQISTLAEARDKV
ncbi:MAG: site-specific DNA-methyltransferase [Chloroflexi bacterium]|nr:site-specific DNA-methyltransferase [Chloroflexota bacterium]